MERVSLRRSDSVGIACDLQSSRSLCGECMMLLRKMSAKCPDKG